MVTATHEIPPREQLLATQPGQIRVIRRNGEVTAYNDEKIRIAITKAFLAVEGASAMASDSMHDIVTHLTKEITATFKRRMPTGGTIHIEDIQDQVELGLMRSGYQKIARAYVLYREERRKFRELEQESLATKTEESSARLHVILENGTRIPLEDRYLKTLLQEACLNLSDVSSEGIIEGTYQNLFDNAPIQDVYKALIMTARTYIENEPNYTYVTARLLLHELRQEALRFLDIAQEVTHTEMTTLYPTYFKRMIAKGVSLELLDPQLATFDLEQLGDAIKPERDFQFTYLGLQTLYDRYFIHHQGTRFELPQAFFMRIAMGLALQEKEKEKWASEFYNVLSSFDYMSSTPTLFNSGTLRPQLSSCYLTIVPDDLQGIFDAIRDQALLSKFAGGLGNDWTSLRASGAAIKGTNGQSSGPIPFLKISNDTALAVDQGGKRNGAFCAYMEIFHLDIEEFLELRKNTGDDRRRTHDMNTAAWVPDLFMKRLFENGNWTLFSPNDVPDLHELYGKAFEAAYVAYEQKTQTGEIIHFKTMPAIQLWRKMLGMLFETGHPWITFKDPCNVRSPQQHSGVVHSSNLCTEITLNTSLEEIAVCNLGSINLTRHLTTDGLDIGKLQKTISVALRMLDNVVDCNYYPVPQARRSNLKHRPVGLGLMGFQDALYALGIDYASEKAVEFADNTMEQISYFAIAASVQLATERGTYPSFEGSLWSKGILPIDSIQLLKEARVSYLEQDAHHTLDWDNLRMQVRTIGMRNSNVMAIAPTATISNICGVSQSIEPTYQNLYVKSNLSGEFTVINPYLVNDLKALGLWDNVMVHDLKYYNGSTQPIERIPEHLKKRYATAFEIDPRWLVEAGSRRQKWIDQAQSLNLYMAIPSGKKLDELYRLAWIRGLKTTYYLRSLAATSTEKMTIHDSSLNAVRATPVCSIDDPGCEACQ